MFIEEDLRPYLGTLIRVGEVSEIHPERGTARVVFDDDDGVVSYELAVLQRNTFDTKDFHSVNVGEDVLCLFLPNGASDGFIVGSFYAGEIDLPESNIPVHAAVRLVNRSTVYLNLENLRCLAYQEKAFRHRMDIHSVVLPYFDGTL